MCWWDVKPYSVSQSTLWVKHFFLFQIAAQKYLTNCASWSVVVTTITPSTALDKFGLVSPNILESDVIGDRKGRLAAHHCLCVLSSALPERGRSRFLLCNIRSFPSVSSPIATWLEFFVWCFTTQFTKESVDNDAPDDDSCDVPCDSRRRTTTLKAQCDTYGVLWGEAVGDVTEHAVIEREQLVDVCVVRDWLALGTMLECVTTAWSRSTRRHPRTKRSAAAAWPTATERRLTTSPWSEMMPAGLTLTSSSGQPTNVMTRSRRR